MFTLKKRISRGIINETIGYSRFIITKVKIRIKIKLIEWKCITVKTYLKDKTVER